MRLKRKSLRILLLVIIIAIALVSVITIMKFKKVDETKYSAEILRSQSYDVVDKEKDSVINDNNGNKITAVSFDAFFLKDINNDGVAESIRGTCNQIGSQANLYMELKVLENGYLKDGTITINSNNFYFNTLIVKDNEIKENYISTNTKIIKLNDITNGTQKMLIGSVRSGDYSSSYNKTGAIGNDTSKYSKENSITFSGILVDEDGNENAFTKTIPFMVDWYGEVNCNITPKSQTVTTSDMNSLLTDDGAKLSFNVTTTETKNQLIMESASISGTIPELNGYMPTSVKISGSNVTYEYNEETGDFRATRQAVINENGIVTSNAYTSSYGTRYNSFSFEVIYPIEAYQQLGENITSFELAIPIEAVNTGYNNTNEEDGFDNPYISNTAKGIVVTTWRKPQEQIYSAGFNIYVGKYIYLPYNTYVISKEKPINIYNGNSLEEKDDTYLVEWRAYTGTYGVTDGIIMNETTNKTDEFLTTSATYISMNELTTNRGIYFSGMTSTLGDDGWIKVYDVDTGTLIKTFTSKDWSNYSASNPYKYETPIKHIKVETSATNASSYFYVYNVKELDDQYITENYTRKEFDNLVRIYSYLDGCFKNKVEEGEESITTSKVSIKNSALYEAPTSIANISIKEDVISTHQTAEHEKITISTVTSGYNEQKWKNGTFLVELPSEIILAEINSITTNNENVNISAYDIFEENGNCYIKILTENDEPEDFNIVIDCDLTADPRLSRTTKSVKLYAQNEIACDYYYSGADACDIDGDGNVTEMVNYRTISLTMDPGSTLSTTQIGSNYGDGDNVTLAPRVAKTDKKQRRATITVSATNNYSYDIQDVKILGVVPFEGNKFVLSGNDLGSTFTTYMSEDGISTLTNSVKDKVTIYYSENGKPSDDLTDLQNGWTLAENIRDWSKIKIYMIVVDNSYKLATGEKIEFKYEIQLPEGVDYNKVAYSEHAIYFALATEEGLYYTSTGSAKLGFMLVKQYDLEIIKYQEDTNKLLEGITFAVTEDGADTSSIRVTNEEGKLVVSGLYVGRYYTLQEIKTIDDYVLNNEKIRFYTYTKINDDGTEELFLDFVNEENIPYKDNISYESVLSSTIIEPSAATGEDYKVQIKLEDEVKAKLAINKVDSKTNTPLKNVSFKLTGEGKKDIILRTDANGNVNISGLYLDHEYTLEEIKATGYYIPQSPIKFTITNNNGNFELSYTDNGTTKTREITKQDEIPTLNLKLENEKIPTYGLKLTKYAKDETDEEGNDKKLKDAQYLITGEGIKDGGKVYTTDENGVLTIDGLYEYVNGKYITGEYTIKEIYAPEGYSINATELKFKAYRESGTLKIQILEGEDVIRKITIDEEEKTDLNISDSSGAYPVIEIGAQDGQIFSLFKYTEEDGMEKPVAGTKFKITDLNGNYVTGSDGKIVGEWIDNTPEQLPVPDITLSSTGQYIWTQRDDGTWESTGNHNISNSTSTLISNEFKLEESAILKFEWSVSSESISYDYVYYTIRNLDNNKTIGGESTKIGGTDYGTIYETLTFNEIEEKLEPGTYKIEVTYKKDSSVDGGLDLAFIRNMRLEQKPIKTTGYYAVTTDENGLITANLPEGLYKAIEVSADDRYVLPENEAERMHYFGIGASQAATWDWRNAVTGNGWNYINSVESTKSGGVIAVGSFSKYENNAEDGIDVNNDEEVDKISLGENDGLIVSYDRAGNYEWSKTFGGEKGDVLNKIISTSDGGYMVVGYVSSKTVSYDGNVINELSKNDSQTGLGKKDGVLIKLDSNGNYNWGIRLGGTLDDEIQSVIETSEKNFVITGSYFSTEFNFYENGSSETKKSIANSGNRDAFVASYSETGKFKWGNKIGDSSNNLDAPDVTEYSNGLAVAVNNHSSSTTDATVGAYIYWYKLDGTSSNVKIGSSTSTSYLINGTSNTTSKITSVDTTASGEIIAGVNYVGTQYDARIYKITFSGTTGTLNNIYTLTGTYDEYVSSVKATSDGGILFGGWYYSKNTSGTDGLTLDAKSGEYACDGYMIKLDSENNAIYSSRLYGDNYDIVNSVTETKDGSLISGGDFNSSTLSATNIKMEREEEELTNPELMITRTRNTEGFVIAGGASGAAVPEAQSLRIENKVKQFKITTEVKKAKDSITGEEVFGGDIDGQVDITYDGVEYSKDGIRYVETVKYENDSVNTIKITPEENYIIDYITINGIEQNKFSIAEDGTVTLPIFENVKEDIHIVVKFSNTISNLEVNYYLWTKELGKTTQKVAESNYETGEVGTDYITTPETDIDYEIITNKDYYGDKTESQILTELGISSLQEKGYSSLEEFLNSYYIPSNYSGKYEDGNKQVVNYYYKEKKYTLTVHHYLEGTNESVPLKGSNSGEKVPDEITEGYAKSQEYSTNQAQDTLIDYNIYELVAVPENATGTIIEDTVVTYYYKIKTAGLRFTKVAEEDNTQAIAGTEFALYELIGTATDDSRVNTRGDDPNWKLVARYTSSSSGTVKLEDLPITSEYRLVEIRSSEGRLLPNGEWEIEFIYGDYDANDTSIKNINGTLVRIKLIGAPPKFIILENGDLKLPNREYYNIPISGGSGIKNFRQIGIAVFAVGIVSLLLIQRRRITIRNKRRTKLDIRKKYQNSKNKTK